MGYLGTEELALLRQLKSTHREGWLRRGIPHDLCETVDQHSVKVALAAHLYVPSIAGIRVRRAVMMAYVHDICEIHDKDYIPGELNDAEKLRRETIAAEKAVKPLGTRGKIIFDLWREYAAKETREAILVGQLDKLDAAVQAIEYKKMGYPVDAFFPYTKGKLHDPTLLGILEELPIMNGNAYMNYFGLLRNSSKR